MAHVLDTHIRTGRAVAGIRGSLQLAPDSARRPDSAVQGLTGAPAEQGAAVLPLRPIHPWRHGTERTGAMAPADNQGRVSTCSDRTARTGSRRWHTTQPST
jgi:hypothetical protein